ncbi:MAG: hypothetical protein FJZ47_06175 [Candidatus Tectomicrobia bacterium]|uniref:OmpR/PhoB-type domain-containing protein n=1 Tax=Tectimicrobiota bacterium TaxID=2528274 RepID=A0A937W094_UNCTE|nr:hypothetical protein [Candidatus Tectomicrobia bacterium]
MIRTSARDELRRGGARVPLRRKVFQVLRYLIEQRDRVVSRDEVLAQVWPDQYTADLQDARALLADLALRGHACRLRLAS